MKIIDQFKINDKVKLILQLGDYKGNEKIDLREFIKLENGKEIPSKKGISFNSEWIDRFIKMVEKLKNEWKEIMIYGSENLY